MEEKPTLVIGDVHGHWNRIWHLLYQEGIVGKDGYRVEHGVRVIQLGDLGHFGGATGTPTGDELCYKDADNWFDLVLWGNHDRAVVDSWHRFSGYQDPGPTTRHYISSLDNQGKLKFAAHAHQHLITHAGLHKFFEQELPDDVEEAVNCINNYRDDTGRDGADIINDISRRRGGPNSVGGILWKDWEEKRSRKFPSICGHTASQTRKVVEVDGNWKIDIGTKENACLAGIWLPDMKVVRVDLYE